MSVYAFSAIPTPNTRRTTQSMGCFSSGQAATYGLFSIIHFNDYLYHASNEAAIVAVTGHTWTAK